MGYTARACIVFVAACVMMPVTAHAGIVWVHLGPLDWTVALEYRGLSRSGIGGDYRTAQFSEELELNQSGYVIDPKIVDFSITLTPTFLQRQLEGTLREDRSEGTTLGYDVHLGALRGSKSPVDFQADASSGTGTLSSDFGHRTVTMREDRSVKVRWYLPAFPMTLGYHERLLDQSISSGDASPPRFRNEFQQSVRWAARSSKLQMQVEKRWFDDRIGDNDYDLLEQSAIHSLRWGKNSHLNTRQRYFGREGANSFKRFHISEELRLQHLENLNSVFQYNYSSTTHTNKVKAHSGRYSLGFRPGRNFQVTLETQGRTREFGTGSEKEYGGAVDLRYLKDIFGNGKMSFALDGSSLQTDRRSNGSTIELLDISYTVPQTLIVFLDTRAIKASSIIVTDMSASQVFLKGVDYSIQTLSGGRTELQIGTLGLIKAGDTILVSYSAATQPSAEFNTGSVQASISLDFDWVRLYHSTQVNKVSLRSGSFGEGQSDLLDQKTGVELKWSGLWFEATGAAETRIYESGDYTLETESFRESAQINISPGTLLVLSANQTVQLSDGQEVDLNQWNVNLDWAALQGMSVKPYVNGWDRRDQGGQFEERLSVGVNLTWRLRKFNLDFDLSHQDQVTQDRDSTYQKVSIRFVRRSR